MIFSPSRMGRLNKRALIRQLQKAGVSSRADLARSLGMSQPTAGKIVEDLLALKILEEVEMPATNGHGPVAGRMGRPGRQLQLNRSEARFLGIQLGLTETWLAELPIGVTDADNWNASFQIPTALRNPAKAWECQMRAAARRLRSRNFLGVMLSVPGVVDESANRILFSPNIHWSENVDLVAVIRKIWNAPVLLVQEECALALGHQVNHPEQEDFLLVDFGDGVGGAVIVGGKPLAHPLPISGEIGHTPVLGNRRQCGCGATGCMETLISTRGLMESFSANRSGKNNSWAGLRADIGQNGVQPWLAQALDAAAVAIAGALNVLGLRRVVITGSLTELPPAVLAHLAKSIQNGSMWAKFGSVECISAPRRRFAGLVAIGIDRLVVPDTQNNGHAGPKIYRRPPATLKLKTKKYNQTRP
jgi:predicted NBD/HSP70 family sugar kinase